MKKLPLKLALGAVAVLVLGFLARNFIARKTVEFGVERATGFPLEIGAFEFGLLKGTVRVRDAKLMNPPTFEEQLFVEIPELDIHYQLGSMLRREPHITEMLVDIKQLTIVKNSKGESNLEELKGVSSSSGGNDGKSSAKYQLDTLRLKVGTVTIKDYSRAKPTERNIPLNINATYNNITDSTDINRLVLLAVMSKVPLPEFGIKPDDITKGLGDVLKGTGDVLEKTGKGVFDVLKKVVPGNE